MARANMQSQKTTDHEFQIRRAIESFVGKKVELRTKSGRNRAIIGGILENACPSVFIVKSTNNYGVVRTMSFRYAEVLIKEVEVAIWAEDQKILISDIYSGFAVDVTSSETQSSAGLVG